LNNNEHPEKDPVYCFAALRAQDIATVDCPLHGATINEP
jgi:hypothetical protein